MNNKNLSKQIREKMDTVTDSYEKFLFEKCWLHSLNHEERDVEEALFRFNQLKKEYDL